MLILLSLRYSRIVSFILSTTYSVTDIPPRRDSAKRQLLSIFLHQSTKSTTGLNINSILDELPKTLLKLGLIDVDRLMFPRRPQDVIFEHIFLKSISISLFFQY